MPWHSAYRRAVQDDPEVAEAYAAGIQTIEQAAGSDTPSLREWSELRELAADIADAVNAQTIQTLSSQIPKGKPRPKFKPVKRPDPAMQKAIRARRDELDASYEDDFLRQIGR